MAKWCVCGHRKKDHDLLNTIYERCNVTIRLVNFPGSYYKDKEAGATYTGISQTVFCLCSGFQEKEEECEGDW